MNQTKSSLPHQQAAEAGIAPDTPVGYCDNRVQSEYVQPIIRLEGVTKVYPRAGQNDLHALDGIDLQISPGEIHGIVGQSGAGKSTLIRCLTGLETPASGTLIVDGQDLSQLKGQALRQARKHIGMVFQAAHLFDSRTAAGNVAYPLALSGVPKAQRTKRVEELLTLVGLQDRGGSYPSQLSGGQRQRVGIARALADEPPILLCDEPTSALDTESTQQILSLIRDVHDRLGVTVLIITHEMSVVREICTHVTQLKAGKVVQTGSLEQVLSDPSSELALELVPLPNLDTPARLGGEIADVVDICFTSTPGDPTGARVLDLVASLGADVAAGTFETVGASQVGRLALAVEPHKLKATVAALQAAQIHAEVR